MQKSYVRCASSSLMGIWTRERIAGVASPDGRAGKLARCEDVPPSTAALKIPKPSGIPRMADNSAEGSRPRAFDGAGDRFVLSPLVPRPTPLAST